MRTQTQPQQKQRAKHRKFARQEDDTRKANGNRGRAESLTHHKLRIRVGLIT